MVSPSLPNATPVMPSCVEAGSIDASPNNKKISNTRRCVVIALEPLVAGSHLPREPSNPSDDVHLFAASFVRFVEWIVGDDTDPRRIAVGDVLEPFGDETHPIVKNEYAGRCRRAPAEVLSVPKTLSSSLSRWNRL